MPALLLLALIGLAAGCPAEDATHENTGGQAFRSLLAKDNAGGDTDPVCCGLLQGINFTSNLPVIIVDTQNQPVNRAKEDATMCTCSTGLKNGDYRGPIKFKVRGGTNTQQYNQILQYAVYFNNSDPFLGMPGGNQWILNGQMNDTFELKYWLGLELSRMTGQYAPRTQHAELFIIDDGTPLAYPKHYKGVYLGMEHIQRGKHRVNVAKNNVTDDPSGGFIMEYLHGEKDPKGISVVGNISKKEWDIKYPSAKSAASARATAYMDRYLNDFEQALYGPTFTDATNGWRKFADEKAWVDWWLTSELVKSPKHGYHSALFMHKNRGGPLIMGPQWGVNQGFGTCCGYPITGYMNGGVSGPGISGGSAISPNGWLFNICKEPERCAAVQQYDTGNGMAVWFVRLWEDPKWVEDAAARYQQMRAGNWSDSAVQAKLDFVRAALRQPAVRTLDKWANLIRESWVYATPELQFDGTVDDINKWLLARLRWLDGAFQQALDPARREGPYLPSYTGQSTSPAPAPSATGQTSLAGR